MRKLLRKDPVGDALTGRRFAVKSSADGCSVAEWLADNGFRAE